MAPKCCRFVNNIIYITHINMYKKKYQTQMEYRVASIMYSFAVLFFFYISRFGEIYIYVCLFVCVCMGVCCVNRTSHKKRSPIADDQQRERRCGKDVINDDDDEQQVEIQRARMEALGLRPTTVVIWTSLSIHR